jgi:hypothetical protein
MQDFAPPMGIPQKPNFNVIFLARQTSSFKVVSGIILMPPKE